MMNDFFKACGAFVGFLVGSFIERHYIHYEIPVGSKNLPFLVSIGFALTFAWKELFAPATVLAAFGPHWGNFIARFIMLLFAMCAWPIVIKRESN